LGAKARLKKGRGYRLKFAQLPADTQKRIIVGYTMDGAEVIRADAERRAPVRTGLLSKEIIRELAFASPLECRVRVGPRQAKKGPFYGPWVEHGTVYAAPRPYMRPAYDNNINGVLTDLGNNIGKRVVRELAKADTKIKVG
jgi:HK97 gp10 family phage protein